MDPLTPTDRFVRLLRERLAERARTRAASRSSDAGRIQATSPQGSRDVVRQSAGAGADDEQLRRTIIEQLLVDRLGASLVNDARFQQVVEQVTDAMSSDPELQGLFAAVVGQVRTAKP